MSVTAAFLRVATRFFSAFSTRRRWRHAPDAPMTNQTGQPLPHEGAPSRHGRRLWPRRPHQCLQPRQVRICANDCQHRRRDCSARSSPQLNHFSRCETALAPSPGPAMGATLDAHLRCFFLASQTLDPGRQQHFSTFMDDSARPAGPPKEPEFLRLRHARRN